MNVKKSKNILVQVYNAKLSWTNGNRPERETRSKQFVELSTVLSALHLKTKIR